MSRTRVLFISGVLPFRRDNGQREKVHHVLQALGALYEVTALFLHDARDRDAAAGAASYDFPGWTELVAVGDETASRPAAWVQALAARVRPEARVVARLREVVERFRPDVAWLEYGYLGQYLAPLRRLGVPAIYVSHNLEAELFAELWAREPLSPRKIRWAPFVLANHLHERLFFPRADRFVCISDADRERYGSWLDRRRLAVLPNFKDGREYAAAPALDPGHPYLVHVGGLDAEQNREGAVFLAREVWPSLRRAHPELRLYLVGRPARAGGARAALEEAARAAGGVVFTGEVASTVPYVKGARAALVPTLRGSGTRTKIVEAAACGVPCVSTTKGVEGLPFRHGDSILVADGAAAFTAETERLVSDGALRASLGERAREVFEAELGAEPNRRRIAELVSAVVQAGRADAA